MSAWFYRDSDGLSHAMIWVTDVATLAVIVLFFLWLRWSLHELTRPQRLQFGFARMLEDEANAAWELYRDEAYDHALLIAFHNGDLIDAMTQRAKATGDAFRGLGRATRATAAVWPVAPTSTVLDPYSRRV